MLSIRPRFILRIATIAVLLLTIAGLITSWIAAGVLVAPCPSAIGAPPANLNATAFTLNSESGSIISGWHTQPEHSNGVIVLLHGIRGSRLSMVERARLLHNHGYATVLIDFQAHGESSGDAITAGHLEKHDVRAAVDFARHEHPNERIGVIGVSLGGAAAVLASPLDIDALAIESVYPNITDAIHNRVAIKLGPFSSIPASLLLIQLKPRLGISPSELCPIDYMPHVDCPVYIASGTADRHTTSTESREMFAAAEEPKDLWLVNDAGHVDLFRRDPIEYTKRIVGFFAHHLRPRGGFTSEPTNDL